MHRFVFAAAITLMPLASHAAPCAGFVDVDDASLFCPNVAWMKARSITLGCGSSTYCPNDVVTRLSLAAFLNRLGDALVPPNVLIVAKVGGAFNSIQSAIDVAKASATAQTPFLVKVAPGVYQEKITLAEYVDVEGSGPDTTIVSSDGVTVRTSGGKSELRNIGIRSTGEGLAASDGAITQRDVDFVFSQTTFRRIAVKTTTPASYQGLSTSGVVVASGTASFRDCSIEVIGAGTSTNIPTSTAIVGLAMDIDGCSIRVFNFNQSGANQLTGVALGAGSSISNSRVLVDANSGGAASGIYVGSGTAIPISATTVEVIGASTIGVVIASSVAVKASSVSVSGPGQNIAVYNSSIENSSILASTLTAPLAPNSFSVQSLHATTNIVGSVLTGTPQGATCVASIDQTGSPIASCM